MPRFNSTPGTSQPSAYSSRGSQIGDLVVEPLRHLREKLRKLPGADDDQTPARTVHRNERLAVERELVVRHAPARCVTRPVAMSRRRLDQLVALDAREQLVEPALLRERLQHELERPAARQPEALGFLGRHAVARRRGLVLRPARPRAPARSCRLRCSRRTPSPPPCRRRGSPSARRSAAAPSPTCGSRSTITTRRPALTQSRALFRTWRSTLSISRRSERCQARAIVY